MRFSSKLTHVHPCIEKHMARVQTVCIVKPSCCLSVTMKHQQGRSKNIKCIRLVSQTVGSIFISL